MQLLVVHQILIASGIALALLFAGRALVLFGRSRDPVDLAIGIASAVVALALVAYLRKVRAKWLAHKRGDSNG